MKSKLPYVYLLLAILVPVAVILIARNCPCAKANATVSGPTASAAGAKAATPKPGSVDALLTDIDARIDKKLADVEVGTEAMIAAEIADLDKILVSPPKDATKDELATALAYKARVYQSALDQPDKAVEIYRQLAKQFPETKKAGELDAFIAKADRYKRLKAVQATLTPGTPFPTFVVKNLAGEPLTLEQFRGKPVLVDFWATWCPYCVKQIPDIKAAYQKFHNKGFEVVGISRDRTRKALEDYIAKNEMPWPQYYMNDDDPEGKFGERYGIYGIPTTFLLDGEGVIIAKNPKPEELDAHLVKLLSANVAVEEAPSALETAMRAFMPKLQTKLQGLKDRPTEAMIAPDLAELDNIIAANKGAKADELAQVLYLKSRLYAELLENFGQAATVATQIKRDYPTTEIARHADEVIKEYQKMQTMKTAQEKYDVGKVFPDFAATDINDKPVSVGQFKGKIVLVDFWATWCPPCVAEIPNIKAAYAKYHDKGFEIIGISFDKQRSDLTEYLKKQEITWTQIFEDKGFEGGLAEKYGIMGIPTMVLIDGEGKVIARDPRGPELEAQLEKVLK